MNNESSQRGVTSLNKLTRIKMSILIVMSMLYLVNKCVQCTTIVNVSVN